jgi:acyl carrier protein
MSMQPPRADMDDVKEAIRDYILSTSLPGEARENLRDDTPLQTSGIIDSLALLGLVAFLAQRYGVDLGVYDTSVERFDRIDDIAATVRRKQAPGGPPREPAAP